MREQLSQGVQSYLKDACRIMNLKVFKIAVYSQIIEEQVSEEEHKGNVDDKPEWYSGGNKDSVKKTSEMPSA
jgi:hypothetical protein